MFSDREDILDNDVKTSDDNNVNKSLSHRSSTSNTRFNVLFQQSLTHRTKATPSPLATKKRHFIDLTVDDPPETETITNKKARHEVLENIDKNFPRSIRKARHEVLSRKTSPEGPEDSKDDLSEAFSYNASDALEDSEDDLSRDISRNASDVLEDTEDDLASLSRKPTKTRQVAQDDLFSLLRKPAKTRQKVQDDLPRASRNVRHGDTGSGFLRSSRNKSGKIHPRPSNPPDDGVLVIIPGKRSSESRDVLKSTANTSSSSFDFAATGNKHKKAQITLTDEESELRRRFLRNLDTLDDPPVTLFNDIDGSTPTVDFQFVNQSILGQGVSKVSDDFMLGCQCKPENGRNCGCEYLYCTCLPEATPEGGKKAFPYSMGKHDKACLRPIFLKSRNHIYECNARCSCGDNCKNRVVQFGRKVKLQIFKTTNRGWGLRCLSDLQKGQFVDTYRGEIITSEESDRRGETRNPDEGNYLMDFDKFQESDSISKADFLRLYPHKLDWHAQQVEEGKWTIEYDADGGEVWLKPDFVACKYVCDGMHVGGPTRFINHSCDPNLQVHTASTNHADQEIYDIAFFAKEDIPAGTELTFDYKDEDDRAVITEEMADDVERLRSYRPAKCLCGSEHCRGYFFT